MKSIQIEIDEKNFNLLWRSLHDRENELLANLSQEQKGSDEAALIANELVYLRLYKSEFEKKGQNAHFSKGAFSLADSFIDLTKL